MCPPPPGLGGRGTLAGERGGWKSPSSDEGTYTVVLYIYMYFVHPMMHYIASLGPGGVAVAQTSSKIFYSSYYLKYNTKNRSRLFLPLVVISLAVLDVIKSMLLEKHGLKVHDRTCESSFKCTSSLFAIKSG